MNECRAYIIVERLKHYIHRKISPGISQSMLLFVEGKALYGKEKQRQAETQMDR